MLRFHKDYGWDGKISRDELFDYIDRIIRNFKKVGILVPSAYKKLILLILYKQVPQMFVENPLECEDINISKVTSVSIKELI